MDCDSMAAAKIQRAWRRARAIASTNCPITLDSAKEIRARGGKVFVICEPEGGHEYIFDHDALIAYCRSTRDFRNVATGRRLNRVELLRIDPSIALLFDEESGDGTHVPDPSAAAREGRPGETAIVLNDMAVLFLRTLLSVCEDTLKALAFTMIDLAIGRNYQDTSHECVGDAYNQVLAKMIENHAAVLVSLRLLAESTSSAPLSEALLLHARSRMETMRSNVIDNSAQIFGREIFLSKAQDVCDEDVESFTNFVSSIYLGAEAASAAIVHNLWIISTTNGETAPVPE